MQITSAQACERLGTLHLLGRNQALRVLQSTDEALDRHKPFIARIGRNRPFDARARWDEQREELADGWYLQRVAVEQMRGRHPVPFLATLGAWVVFGGEIENGATWTLWGARNSTPTRADSFSAYYQKQLDDERFMKHLYSTARHRSLARTLDPTVVDAGETPPS